MTEGLKDTGTVFIQVAVPPELVDIGVAPDLQRFFDAMVYKLRRNSHKGRWADVKLSDAMSDLNDECVELASTVTIGSTSEILMEAADVANEALIVAAIALEAKTGALTPPQPAPAGSSAVDRGEGAGDEQSQGHGDA
jgi:hypothetical protein